MDAKLINAATKMGYRMVRKYGGEMLVKPVGFSLYTISKTTKHGIEFTQWFREANNKTLVWDRNQYFEEKYKNFLYWIKYCENWIARDDIATDKEGEFEFLTVEQTFELEL